LLARCQDRRFVMPQAIHQPPGERWWRESALSAHRITCRYRETDLNLIHAA
jgi:hypothetical protein